MNFEKPIVYAVKHKDSDVIASSRSGGIFTAVTDYVLDQNGVVYGCVLKDDFTAEHIRATTKEERNLMRGSKYIQSKLNDSFKRVKQDLSDHKLVLFSGTSCQIAGLKKFLNCEYENLICLDIVCHGVPSEKVWLKYLDWHEKQSHSKVKSATFRNKKDYGWKDHVVTLEMENNDKVDCRVFTKLFYGHQCLRPCCYECPYKSVMHPGDITIADYWGIEKAAPEFDDNKGVSLVLVNNKKGVDLFEEIKDTIRYKNTRIEDSLQQPLVAPFPKPNDRDKFWDDLKNKDFDYIVHKYGEDTFIVKYMNKIKRVLGKIKRKLVG